MKGFDRLAQPYRWMEYLSFGTALERCRFAFLPQLHNTQHALLLGDGDGRFTAALMKQASGAYAVAMDGSEAMLNALRHRCEAIRAANRLTTVCMPLNDGLSDAVKNQHFDLIATHFFLDCLTEADVERVTHDATECATPNTRWTISEFRIPDHGAMRLPARVVVRLLYIAFGMLTGLRTQRLPVYEPILRKHGWQRAQQHIWLGGLLVSELWEREKA